MGRYVCTRAVAILGSLWLTGRALAFAGLRAFALSRSWFLSILACSLSMVPVIVNLVSVRLHEVVCMIFALIHTCVG